jgi:hypothetical protein
MNRGSMLALAVVCILFILAGATYYYVLNLETGPGRAFYLTEPAISNDTVTVWVTNSTNPVASDIYVGFFVNDGGGAIHPDSYVRRVSDLSNDTTGDWIAYLDNDLDGTISTNDSFVISREVLDNYPNDGYIDIAFSDEGLVRYLAMINIDASEI